VLVDGAQSAPHRRIDVEALDCDFFALSGHKMYGPTGIGVLYGKRAWLNQLPPYMGGGEMIRNVSFEKTTYNDLPYKFEAGTPDYVASTGLARAIDYMEGLGLETIRTHEEALTQYAVERLSEIEGMHIWGLRQGHPLHGVVSFQVGHIHHLDMGTLLDRLGIAVRTGHHCAEPLMHRLGIEGTCRASFALYNTREEVDALAAAVRRVQTMF
jgi:cysteine desulfurase/selenocysteine lyase